ncbi:MAG: hypothetical protein PHY64_03600 [Eubacteriales bacterium]|nr:hypothetical protein [Eubacteriales bacterium]
MRVEKQNQRLVLLIFMLCMLLALPSSQIGKAEVLQEAQITEESTAIGDNSVRYPQLAGMADAQVQQTINDAIVEKAKIAQRLVTLGVLQGGGSGLTVDYDAYVGGGVFSAVINAVGVMENGRSGQSYTGLCFDLATGEPVSLSALFTDVDGAVAQMEATLEDTYLDELSSYLAYAELTPLPTDNFSMDADGITFYYPADQFSLLSGYCGAAQFNYDEISDFLRTDEGSLPVAMGILPQTLTDTEMKAKIEQAAKDGTLPHVRATLDEPMTDLIGKYRLLRQPDQYPGGKYYQLEAPMFRQILVLSDALTSGYENSVVEGIMSFRTNLYCIQTGVTPRDRWLAVLGNPQSTVVLDEELAYDYGLPVGTADYYTIGSRQLLLYADESDTLYAIRLSN